jgi:hypothetical protein
MSGTGVGVILAIDVVAVSMLCYELLSTPTTSSCDGIPSTKLIESPVKTLDTADLFGGFDLSAQHWQIELLRDHNRR